MLESIFTIELVCLSCDVKKRKEYKSKKEIRECNSLSRPKYHSLPHTGFYFFFQTPNVRVEPRGVVVRPLVVGSQTVTDTEKTFKFKTVVRREQISPRTVLGKVRVRKAMLGTSVAH